MQQPIGYTARQLIATYKWVKANPAGTVKISWCTTLTSHEWMAWFKTCLNNKITCQDDRYPTRYNWKKYDDEYQSKLAHDVRMIRDYINNRACFSGCNLLYTPEMKARYPHINTRRWND